jgi:alkanesulfonate monooxygenase SsuD/methylene tetrahydromethanopterin reductase-like flavin-dependent oxidoreductase (luciferase family)
MERSVLVPAQPHAEAHHLARGTVRHPPPASRARSLGPGWTRRQLIDQFILGSRQRPVTGSAAQVAEALIGLVEATGVDGFNLSRTIMPECLESVVALLVPALQERGACKQGYALGTYREKLFGAGPRLESPHPPVSR